MAGDGALEASDNYIRILGRIDDVINVAGHRLGTKEIESACLTVPEVAEAAVVPVADDLKGRVPDVYIALKPGVQPNDDIVNRIINANETSSAKSRAPSSSTSCPTCPRRAVARSCAASSPPSPTPRRGRCDHPCQPQRRRRNSRDGAGQDTSRRAGRGSRRHRQIRPNRVTINPLNLRGSCANQCFADGEGFERRANYPPSVSVEIDSVPSGKF